MIDAASPTHAPVMECVGCGTKKSAKKARSGGFSAPNGWKRIGERLLCGKCKDADYAVRAITVPVASVEVDGESDPKGAWGALRLAYHTASYSVAHILTWAVGELALADPARTMPLELDKKFKLPPYKTPYLYHGAKTVAPGFFSSSIPCVLQRAERAYSALRLAYRLKRVGLPAFKAPQPVPFPAKSAGIEELSGVFYVSLNLMGRRFKLRLRGGSEFRRQLRALKRIVAGEVVAGEVALHEISGGRADHRPLVAKGARIVVKIAALFPKEKGVALGRTLVVTTGKDCFLRYALDDSDMTRVVNGDHVRRWTAEYGKRIDDWLAENAVKLRAWVNEHRKRLDRTSADAKRWHGWPAAIRDRMISARLPWIENHANRTDTWCHTITRMLVDYAKRTGVVTIRFDGSCKDYVREFPWFKLKTYLASKSNEAGIQFVDASAEPVEETAPVLAEP